ncbi:MAG: hypothetical protein Q8908_00930 [Bacteroidota bacterium]|nr:hypothetical protein [Bacteroidota bacterium]
MILESCYYDNEVYLYGNGSGAVCDTATVTYSATIAPIMASNCNSCHTASSGNGVITSDYNNLKTIVNNGKLLKSVNWTAGAIQMPLGGQKLPTCTLAKINKWVDNGALNN